MSHAKKPMAAQRGKGPDRPHAIHVLAARFFADEAPLNDILQTMAACPGVHFVVDVVVGRDEAEEALSGRAAVDILLVDIDFDCPDSFRDAEALVRKTTNVPVLVLAQKDVEARAWRMCAEGAQGVLVHEPIDCEVLVWRVKQTIEQFIMRDTLERQLGELETANGRFLSLVVDNADAIIVVDRTGVVRFVNPSAELLLRCSASDLLGHMFGIPLEGIEETEIDLPRRVNSESVAEIRVMRTLWDGERAYIVTMRDVSERKKSERALLLAKQTAEQASQMKSRFLANMSHELRTPLNAIIGFSELMLLDDGLSIQPEHYQGYVHDIQSAGTHLLSLINDLLDLSKAESGNIELHEEPFDLVTLAGGAVELVSAEAELKGLFLSLRTEVRSAWMRADERLIKQVLLNLLSNALKWTAKGGRIEVSVKRLASNETVLAVADTGSGIPKELIPRVFSAFVQLDNGYTRAEKSGTGLGLALGKRFTELHGGRIHLDSEPNVGTTVTITLPATRSLVSYTDGGDVISISDTEIRENRVRPNRHANDC